MELYNTIFTVTIVLSTDAKTVHEYFGVQGCSDVDGEDVHGMDEEELWHANFIQEKGVITLPDFADPRLFPGFYENSAIELKRCKSDVVTLTKIFKSPPPEMDPPQMSIYPRHNVKLGVQNTLVCHVTGFYPPSLGIVWTKNNVNVTEDISLSQYRPKTDGTFNIFSTLKFTPGEGDIYSCTVNHEALQGQAQTKEWEVDVTLPSVGPSVFCGICVTLGLLGIGTGTYFFIKAKNCN